jgi:hypothetical protein
MKLDRILNAALNVLAGAAVTLGTVWLVQNPPSTHPTHVTHTIQRDAVFHIDTRHHPVRSI